jgi:hypothetical protein
MLRPVICFGKNIISIYSSQVPLQRKLRVASYYICSPKNSPKNTSFRGVFFFIPPSIVLLIVDVKLF